MIKHTVKRGDTLSKIGMKYGYTAAQWKRVWAVNPKIKNPNLIYPGQIINVPIKKSGTVKAISRALKPAMVKKAGLSPVQMLLVGDLALGILFSTKKGKRLF